MFRGCVGRRKEENVRGVRVYDVFFYMEWDDVIDSGDLIVYVIYFYVVLWIC